MKNLLLITIILLFTSYSTIRAQVFVENFEGATLGLTSTSSDATSGTAWGINTRLASQGVKCDSVFVTQGDVTWLTTTNSFSTVGKYAVYLDFDQICKVKIFDSAYVEVSNDNGATWQRVTDSHYLGTGLFGTLGNRFHEGSYTLLWDPVNPAALPQNSWWKHESFDISSLASNATDVKVRFALADGNNLGAVGRAGWFLDSIVINASISEMIPPSIVLNAPIVQDTVYNDDPVTISASISDGSGIDSALCIVNILPNNTWDTILMVYDASTVDTFSCQIPFYGFGRTTKYYVLAWDASFGHNVASTSTYQYIAKNSPGGIAEIGIGSASSAFPFYTYYMDARTQIIYTAAEINTAGAFAGSITSIAFDVTSAATQAMGSFTVKMKSSSISALTGFEATSSFTTVYSPASYTVPGTGWQTITLATPFIWDGVSNLIIEICFDNAAYTSSSTVNATSSTGMTWGLNQDVSSGGGCSLTGGTGQGNRPNIQINIASSGDLTNDIGVKAIVNPTTGVIAGTNFDINVDMKNFGVDTISSAQINWTYDGVAQTAYTFGAPNYLLPDSIAGPITVGTQMATVGAHYIMAWTNLPNGTLDNDIMNDTAKMEFYGCASLLSGAYTIGGATADFLNFSEAILALDQCGISAPVVFNVNDGIYNEQLLIENISGISSTNTVSFQSVSGDSSTVIIKHLAIDTNDNYVVKVDGVSNITFSNMTFEATDNTNARVFVFINDVNNISINNNIIKNTIPTNNDNDMMSLIIGNMGNNIAINSNSMINGAYAIKLYADAQGENWEILNNTISNVLSKAIFLNYAKSATISTNTIYANTLANTNDFIGLDLQNNFGSALISKNEIYSTISQLSIGINLYMCNYTALHPAKISNNFIQLYSTASVMPTSGIKIINSSNSNIYFNTVNIVGNQSQSAAISLEGLTTNASQNNNFVNNIFANNATGYIYFVNNIDTSLWVNKYNDLWNNNAANFAYLNGDIADFSDWQNISGETNSLNINPYFVSSTDIHIINNAMNATGVVVGGITTDIDGDTRDTNTPDIGADEFDPSPWDASVIGFDSISEGCGLSNETITIDIKNLGSADINGNCTASYRISPTATIVTEAISNFIAAGDTFTYTFTTLANLDVYPYGQDSVFNMEAWVSLQSDPIANNDSAFIEINSKYAPLSPIVSDTLISYGDSASITATSPDSLIWFETNAAIIELSKDRWYQTGVLFDTTTYWVGATAGAADIKLTETVQYKLATGATNPYPIYLPMSDFDGIEITNLGTSNGDLSGYTINISVSSVLVSYTFPANTSIAIGDIVLVVYGYGFTVGPAGNNVFYAPYINISSNTLVSYWLTDNAGNVVDAFASNGATFPSSSPVTTNDFSGSLMGGISHPGAVRVISDNNNATDWQVINPALASFGTANPSLNIVSQGGGGCYSTLVPLTVKVNNIPQNDISIVQLISPLSGHYLISNANVEVEVANYGVLTKDTIPLAYQLNSQAIVYDTLFQTLTSGEIALFTFGQTIDLSQFGSYNFEVYTNLSYDTESYNDSVISIITNDSLIYCVSNALYSTNSRIDEVKLEGINNNTSADGCSTYSDFSSISTVLSQGTDCQISVTLGSCGYDYSKGAKAWIDFNNDGDFDDSGEEIGNFGSSTSIFTATATFTVPIDATIGTHKLRVVGRESPGTNNISIEPCGTYYYGETEDYSVIIVPLIQFDAGVKEVFNIADTSYEGANITPIVVVKNYGFDTLTSFDVLYNTNGGTAVVYNYNSILLPFQEDTITLASFISPAGNNIVSIYTYLSTDLNPLNDSDYVTYYGIPTKDAEVLSIQEIDEYCGMDYDTIRVQLTNIGIDTINATGQTNPTTISYQSNSLTPITEVFTQIVAPGDTVWYQFSSLVYVGSNNIMDSVYNILTWINYIGDNVAYNDSISYLVESLHSPSQPTVVNPVLIPYASPATLIANNAPGDSILWFEDSLSVDAVFGGSPYITPWLNLNDTTFWVASVSGGPPVTSIIGTGSTSNSSQSYPSPYANYYWGNKEQYLILASEIIALGGSAGPISELAFDVASPNSCPNLQNFEMKIGASSQASLTTYETGLTTIFSSISGYQTINGWNNHIFSTPFIWDGISNIVIQVCSQNSGYVNNGNASVKRTTTSFNSVRYYRADNTGVCGNSSGTSSSLRPNMKMLISGTACQSDKTPVDITILPLSACDVGVSDLVGPTSSIYMGTNETVIAKVHNYGNVDQTNIPISYQINNGTIITENVSVPASSSVVYSFITKADFSNSGSVYNVKLSTSLSCDTTSLNNDYQELVSNIIPTYCVSSANYNSYHDIENVTVGSINNTSPSPFDKQYTDYTNINPGTLNPGNNYPISIKINSITSSPSGGFIKVFIDYNRDGVFDPTLEKAVAMPYNNASSNSPAMAYGSIVVPSNVDLGLTRMRVVAVRSGTATTVQPCGTYDYGETEDYPIYLANTIPHDASISMISSPSTLTTSSSVPVSVRVHNYGTDPISSVDISYSVNNNPSTIITYNSTSINQGNYVDVPLGNISIFDGMNNICARTILAGDSNIFNDSRCVNVFKEVIVNLSYSDDFEGVNLWMNDTVANQWERGSPNMTTINTAHSPSNVWATNLSGSYAGAAVQYLYSPKFDITSNIDSAQFEFWHYYITEVTNDGAYIQYKKNNGLWVALGYTTDPRATNWYTSTTGGIHKWTGNSGGWIQSTFNFNFLIGEFNNTNSIQFRYMFYSNSSNNNYDGWAIDDVSFNLPIAPSDVGVIAINTPATSVQVGETITVSIDVRNHGNNVQTTIPVWYQLNNDGIVTETLNISGSGLSLGDVATYNFTIPFVAPGTDFQLCVGTDLGVDDYPQNDDMCTSLAVTSANIDGGVTSVGILQSYVISGDTTIITDGDITNPITVIAEVKNFGVTTLTSFDIKYSKDGGSNWVTESWTGSLATNEVDTFEFVTTYNSPMGNYSICVRTDVPNDALAVNDENCAAYVGMVTIESAIENAFAVSQNEPNPAYGNVRIDYIVPTDGEIVFELLNSLGQMVYSADKASFVGDNSIEIDTKDFSSGVYYYTITFDGQRITRKMVVNQ